MSLPDPRNTTSIGASLPDGGRYSNIVNGVSTRNMYAKWPPVATFVDDVSRSINSGATQKGILAAALYGTDFTTYDFSSAFDLTKILGIAGAPQLTVNVANLTNATLRSYFQLENAPFTQYKPGR